METTGELTIEASDHVLDAIKTLNHLAQRQRELADHPNHRVRREAETLGKRLTDTRKNLLRTVNDLEELATLFRAAERAADQ